MRARPTRRPLRVARNIALALVTVLGVAILVGPALLDVPHIKAQVERKVSEAAQGQVTWDSLQVRLLPAPRGEFRNIRMSGPRVGHARAQQVTAYLRLGALLLGRTEIASITAVRPVVEIDLGPATSPHTARELDLISAYRSALAPVMQSIRQVARDASLEVDDGTLQVRGADLPDIRITQLAVRARAGAKGLELEATSASNLWNRLHVAAQVQFADLSGHSALEVTDLKPQLWLDRLSSDTGLAIAIASANVQLQAHTDGKTSLAGEFALQASEIAIARSDRRLQVPEFAAKGKMAADAQQLSVDLSEVRLGTLIPSGRVALTSTLAGGSPHLVVEIPRADVAMLRDAVLALTDDNTALRFHMQRLRAGELIDVKLDHSADNFPALSDLDRLTASATLSHGRALIPLIEQEVEEIAAAVRLADGKVTLERATAQIGPSKLTGATVHYSLNERAFSIDAAFEMDLRHAVELARSSLRRSGQTVLADVQSVSGGVHGRVAITVGQRDWLAAFHIVQSDSSLRLRQFPWPIALRAGHVSGSSKRISVRGASGSIGKWPFADVAAEFTRGGVTRLDGASGHITISLDDLYPWLRSHKALEKALTSIHAASGTLGLTLNHLSGPLDEPAALDYDVSVQPQRVSVHVDQLPAPLELSSGSIRIDRRRLLLDQLVWSMLDAHAGVSGTIDDYRAEGFKAQWTVADGSIGPKAMEWIWERAEAPPDLQPKTPIRFVAQQLVFTPQAVLGARATARFDAGPTVTFELGWKPHALDIRRLAIKDQHSNAVLGLSIRDRVLQANFSGALHGSSLAAMLKMTAEYSGSATGDLRLTFDREHPQRTTAEGHLQGARLDLSWLIGQPVKIEEIDVEADGAALQIHSALVNWAQQAASIRGTIKLGESGPVIDAQLESPGIVADRLLESMDKIVAPRGSAAREQSQRTKTATGLAHLWPLPITGRLRARAAFIEYDRYRVAPVSATITLQENRAQIDVQEARLCGVSIPYSTVLTPQAASTTAHITARRQQLESAISCLTGETTDLTGEFDLQAELSVNGIRPRIPGDLEGTVQLESRNGEVKKAPLLARLLSLENIASAFERGTPKLERQALPYRRLKIEGRLHERRFIADEIAFDSDALGLGATGSIDLVGSNTRLVVLVAPFSRTNRLVRAVPLVGYVVGSTFTTVPVSVSGDIRNPLIVPLGPEAITSQVLGIFERTFKLPGRMLKPLEPRPSGKPQAAPQ